MAGYLVAEEGPLSGLVIRLEEGHEWIIGRDPDVSFQVLEDPMVSRKHLICRLTEEGFVVENLSTVNPASLNGRPITDPATLQEGDTLQIGGTLFTFTEHDPQLAPLTEKSSFQDYHPTIFDEESPLDSLSFNEVTSARWMIKVISGPNTGAEFGLQPGHSYILGKDPHSCDVIFQDLSVSRQHAKITLDEQSISTLEDLKSRNGTYVNGHYLEAPHRLASQDLVSIGTTSFLLIDREQTRETLYSPASFTQAPEPKEAPSEEPSKILSPKTWKNLFIPTKHLILAGTLVLLILIGISSALSLFKTHHIELAKQDDQAVLEDTFKKFVGVDFSFNPATGTIFVVGDVLTEIEKQELLYLLKSLPFIRNIEDNITIDEIVWSDMNAFLARNPNWRAVTMTAYAPGKFTLKGYVQTQQDALNLAEYITLNFPYNEKLDNQVVVANTLETQVQALLMEKGFVNITFQLTAGELVLTGRLNESSEKDFSKLLQELKKVQGIRSIKNFV
ncbi:MAG: EscD/YscD/HrpQ family type III secretion system inner membrane ring protein, partial [Chlamydiae bacterium]|nr:EscD/YscD/HrpQ family type III secretion system inner membrane ring protein [Chlamydiota bacterium]